jgi:hypothetical protein
LYRLSPDISITAEAGTTLLGLGTMFEVISAYYKKHPNFTPSSK